MANPNVGTKGTTEIETDYPTDHKLKTQVNLIPEDYSNVICKERVGLD